MRQQQFRATTTEQDIAELARNASPEALTAALALLRNGTGNGNGGTAKKRQRKQTKFHGSDHALLPEEFRAICSASTPFYSLLWRTMLHFGFRVSEALSLRPQDLDGTFLSCQRLKGSEFTRQSVPPALLAELQARVATGGYRLFPCSRSSAFLHFRAAARQAGIDRKRQHPHVLRHTCICLMLNGGIPVHVASRHVGHRSISSTAQYTNVSDLTASAAAAKVFASLFDAPTAAPATAVQ